MERSLTKWRLISTIATFTFTLLGLLGEIFSIPALNLSYILAYCSGSVLGLRAGFDSLRQRKIDIDLLMVLAAIGAAIVGEYFEGSLLLFLFSLSNLLQDMVLEKTNLAMQKIMDLAPATAEVMIDNSPTKMNVDDIALDSVIMIRPGTRIALDCVVISGSSSVDQSIITGESIPKKKRKGDMLFAGTINGSGSLMAKTISTSENATLAETTRLVEQARKKKTHTQVFLDKYEQLYASLVIVATALLAIIMILLDYSFSDSIYRAMTLLVATSPCALIISTPITAWAAINAGAKQGVIFKSGRVLEQLASIKTIAFDKTGTVTENSFQISDIEPVPASWNNLDDATTPSKDEILTLIASAEQHSEHLLARAALEEARKKELALGELVLFESIAGSGIIATVGRRSFRYGNIDLFSADTTPAYNRVIPIARRLQNENKTVVMLGETLPTGKTVLLGVVAYSAKIRPEARRVADALHTIGRYRLVLISGDNKDSVQEIASLLHIDEFYANMLPKDKLEIIERLEKQRGGIAMIGDGVNDAPALARSTVGIAMGAIGTDVARETADVVLISDDLNALPFVFGMGKRVRRTLLFNLIFATGVIVTMALALMSVGIALPLAVIGHEGSTVLVSLNGARLLFAKSRRNKK